VILFIIVIAVVVIGLGGGLLGWLLLLLFVLGLALLGQRLLEDLEHLLVRDLLVALDLRQVKRWRGGDLLEAVLGDGCSDYVSQFFDIRIIELDRLTNGRQ